MRKQKSPTYSDDPMEWNVYQNSVGKWNASLDLDLSDPTVRHGTRGSRTKRAAIQYALKELNRKVRHYRAVMKAAGAK